MFKNEVGLVPKPISQLFTKNNEYHDYNTRHSSSLHLSVGRGEAIYRSFSFHGINIWNYLKRHVPIDVSYIRFKKLTISYLTANDIVYNVRGLCKRFRILKISDMFSVALWKFYYKLMNNKSPEYFSFIKPVLPVATERYEIRNPSFHAPAIKH